MNWTYNLEETLLDNIFEVEENIPPLVVFDFKVICHSIHSYHDLITDIHGEDREKIYETFKAMWAYKLNRGPDMLPQMDFTGLVIDDVKGDVGNASVDGKGYWRHIEAKTLNMGEYKGGRQTKPESFSLCEQAGYDYIHQEGSTFHYFSKPYFEADDCAGEVCRIKRSTPENKRNILLYTLDGDWQGLVSNKYNITWVNTGPWLPRVRGDQEVIDYYFRKDGVKIDSPYGCYTTKEKLGDAGDGLAAGSPLRFFDLYNRDEKWNFSESESSTLRNIVSDFSISTRHDHLHAAEKYLLSQGYPLPVIGFTDLHDAHIFLEKAKQKRLDQQKPKRKRSIS